MKVKSKVRAGAVSCRLVGGPIRGTCRIIAVF